MTDQEQIAASAAPAIGGWLWLPAIGLAAGWIQALSSTGAVRMEVYQAETSGLLVNVSYAKIFEKTALVLLVIDLIFNFIVARAFFRRRRAAPKLVIAFQIFGLIYAAIIVFGCREILGVEIQWAWFIFGIALAGIWIWYFLVSKRVKETFIN